MLKYKAYSCYKIDMKRKILTLLCVAVAGVTLAACHKNCACYGYDGQQHDYTADEVDAHGGSCSNMIIQAQTRFYSYCHWE